MDAILLSRFQFGFTVFFHFLFPPLSIGLATIIAFMEYKYWRSRDPLYDSMARFWFKLFSIIFAVGVATGIAMEFQFGTNWSEYSAFVGDIFGAPLAAEGLLAFFLESTFMGLLLFGRDKIGRTMRFAASVLVAGSSTLSAFWIIAANSWMQTPTAFKVENGRAIMTDFWGAIFNPSTIPRFLHTVDAACITGAFFVMGVSAYILLKGKNLEMARKSLKISVVFGLIAVLLQFGLGDTHSRQVAVTQPVKMAAFEGMWETQSRAPFHLIGFPDPKNEVTRFDLGIPGLLSLIVYKDVNAVMPGLKDYPAAERPPVLLTYWSYRLMVAAAGWMLLITIAGAYLLARGKLYNCRIFLYALVFSTLIPVLVNELGWMAAEFGRQPWIVYGLLKTEAAVSPLPAYQVLISTVGFFMVYAALFVGVTHLIIREIRKKAGQSMGRLGAPLDESAEIPGQGV